jgi:capsular exopolysaccharide synthesis family protein
MAVVVPIAALVTSARQPELYSSTAEVLLSRQDLGSALTGTENLDLAGDPARFAQTQADIARVKEVAERALKRSGVRGRSASELLANSTVIPRSNADLLKFTVTDRDPNIAPRLATAYAEAFTSYRSELDTATLKRAREELEATIGELRRSGGQRTEVYRDLVAKAQDLRTMELLQIRNAVVQPATSSQLVLPTPKRNALIGLMLGLVLGLVAAFLWEALDRRVRSEEEIERRLDLTLLARLPTPPRELRSGGRLAMLNDMGSGYLEAVRRLRTNLEFANIDANARVIAVTSALEGEGKTTTIANLAVALARAGHRTALVDMDLRQPFLARLFGLEGRPGVTDVATGHANLREILVPQQLTLATAALVDRSNGQTSPGQLFVLPSGHVPTSPGEFVGSQAIARLIDDLRKEVEYVLVDAPPLLVVGDTMTLSNFVDALLVVVRTPVAHRTTLIDLARELDASPATKLGFVLTGADDAAHGYGYGYGYGSGRESARRGRSRADESAEVEVLPSTSRRA